MFLHLIPYCKVFCNISFLVTQVWSYLIIYCKICNSNFLTLISVIFMKNGNVWAICHWYSLNCDAYGKSPMNTIFKISESLREVRFLSSISWPQFNTSITYGPLILPGWPLSTETRVNAEHHHMSTNPPTAPMKKLQVIFAWFIINEISEFLATLLMFFLLGTSCCSCPKGWIGYHCSCYYISNDRTSWEESRNFCASHNSSLLQLHTKDELASI